MQNRYKDILKKYNQKIISLSPANQTLREVLGYEFSVAYKAGMRVLEIGCGEGDSTKVLLGKFLGDMDLLDVSAEMIAAAEQNLRTYRQRLRFIKADASEYLKTCNAYDIITTSWVLHNFLRKDNAALLRQIYAKLEKGGYFLLMDKIYPQKNAKQLLRVQVDRYKYLPRSARIAITEHEKVDFTKNYRLNEKEFVTLLRRIGFKNIQIVDRVERDIVITVRK